MRKFLDVFGQTAFEAHTERFNDPTNWNAASRSEVVNECGGGLSVMHYCTDDVHRIWGKQHQFVAGLCSHGKMGKWKKKETSLHTQKDAQRGCHLACRGGQKFEC